MPGMLKKHRRLLLILLVACVVLAAIAAALGWSIRRSHQRQQLLDAAAEAEQAGQWTAVESALRRYQRLAGDDAETCLRIGRAIEQGAVDDRDRLRALPFYTKALYLSPKSDEARLRFAELQVDENPRDAVKYAALILQQQPQHPDALRIKALGLARLILPRDEAESRLLEAYQTLDAAIQCQPGDVRLATVAAEFQCRQAEPLAPLLRKQPDELRQAAEAVLTGMVEHAEDESEARLNRLLLRRELGLTREHDAVTQEDLNRLVVLRPESNVVRLLAAGWSARQAFPDRQPDASGHYDAQAAAEAKGQLNIAIENRPNDPVPYWSLAQMCWWSGQREAALAALLQGREAAGADNVILNLRIAETQLALGQWAEARNTLNVLAELTAPTEPDATDSLYEIQPLINDEKPKPQPKVDLRPIVDLLTAQWYLAVGNPGADASRAVVVLDRYAEQALDPGLRSLANYLRGLAFAAQDRWEEAASAMLIASQSSEATVLPRISAANCLYHLGRYREAAVYYRYALSVLRKGPQGGINVDQIWIELARCELAEQSQYPAWRRDLRAFDQTLETIRGRLSDSPIPLFLNLEASLLKEEPAARSAALAELKQARQAFADSPEFWGLLAGYCLRAGELDAAAKAVETVERLNGQPAVKLRAELALARDEFQQADDLWASLSADRSQQTQRSWLTQRVQTALASGRTEYAHKLLEDWLAEHSTDRQAKFQLAQVAWAAGDLTALETAAKLLATGPDGTDRLNAVVEIQILILTAAQQGDRNSREQLTKRTQAAVSQFPDDRQIAVLEALSAESTGDVRRATQAWQRAFRLGEQAPSSRLRLASLLHSQGQSREALDLCLSLPRSNRDCRAATLAARIMTTAVVDPAVNQYAEELFQEKLTGQSAADLPLLLLQLAVLREYQGKPEESIVLTNRAQELLPEAVEPKNNLAWFLAAYGGDVTVAEETIAQAIQAAGPLPALLDTQGVVLLAAGRVDEAVAALQASVRGPTPSATRWLHLAEALQAAGRADEAKEALEQAESLGLTRLVPRDRKSLLKLKAQL